MPGILLVEDSELNRDMLSCRLERNGYSIAIAMEGLQSVDMASATAYDVVLMDMSLPVMGGWEATRQIRDTCRKVLILALIAHAMEGNGQRANAAGCDDDDTKPVELPRLPEKMEALLNG